MTHTAIPNLTAWAILAAIAVLVVYALGCDLWRVIQDRRWQKRKLEIQREFDAAVAEQQAEHDAREREQLKRLAAILDFDAYRHDHSQPRARVQ